MEKIVITGGAGFIGSHVTELALRKFPKAHITVIDKLTYAGDRLNLREVDPHGRVKLRVADLVDAGDWEHELDGADLVLHLAAESHVDRSFMNPSLFTRTNVLGTENILLACVRNGVSRLIHVSTDEVYGERLNGLCTEEAAFKPTNPYAASKAAADLMVMSYQRAWKLSVNVVRSNNVYGVRQFPEKIIPRFICNALKGLPLPIHGSGLNVRNYVSAQDFSAAILLIVERAEAGQIFNIGSPEQYTNVGIAGLICGLLGADPVRAITYTDDRRFNDSRYGIDDKKIRALGWQPRRNLQDDLPAMIEWYRRNLPRYGHFLNTKSWRASTDTRPAPLAASVN